MRTTLRRWVKRHDDSLASLAAIGIVGLLGAAIVIGILLGSGLIMRWAWGLAMVSLFGLRPISFGEALGLVLILGFVGSLFHGRSGKG